MIAGVGLTACLKHVEKNFNCHSSYRNFLSEENLDLLLLYER